MNNKQHQSLEDLGFSNPTGPYFEFQLSIKDIVNGSDKNFGLMITEIINDTTDFEFDYEYQRRSNSKYVQIYHMEDPMYELISSQDIDHPKYLDLRPSHIGSNNLRTEYIKCFNTNALESAIAQLPQPWNKAQLQHSSQVRFTGIPTTTESKPYIRYYLDPHHSIWHLTIKSFSYCDIHSINESIVSNFFDLIIH